MEEVWVLVLLQGREDVAKRLARGLLPVAVPSKDRLRLTLGLGGHGRRREVDGGGPVGDIRQGQGGGHGVVVHVQICLVGKVAMFQVE